MIKNIIITAFLILLINANANQNKTITVAGPSASVTHPIFHMIKNDALKSLNTNIKFKQWKNPDELKALILNKKVDFIAVPITAGTILYNRGANVQLLSLVMGGARGIVTSNKNIKTIKDLKGCSIGIASRGGLADSLIKILIEKNGMDYKKDIKIVYTQTSKNSSLLLLKGKIDCAVLSEPRISMTLKKAKSLPSDKTPHKLFFTINLLDTWKKTFNTTSSFAQVGFLAVGDTIKNKELKIKFIKEYEKSLNWYINNPEISSLLASKYLKGLHPKAIRNGIKNSNLHVLTTLQNKELIKELLNNLLVVNPKSMGKKLPNDGFYLKK
ncbi:MAG: ABC transporter substrate-binding protein [Campylobacterota bacterium]|nr:ABC transporter substrate-binding protein [Campylobacterota bacterium]